MIAAFTGRSTFDPVPSVSAMRSLDVAVASEPPTGATTGWFVSPGGPLPGAVDWGNLEAVGFHGKVGQTQVIPPRGGEAIVVVGVGGVSDLTPDILRDAAAAFSRATSSEGTLAMHLPEDIPPATSAQMVVEGTTLARYRYDALKRKASVTPIDSLTLVTDARAEAEEGAAKGVAMSEAAQIARDLANTPPALLTALKMAEVAEIHGHERGLDVEIFDIAALVEMGCGGLLGVNAGSHEPPAMIKVIYVPKDEPKATLTLVGKGIMYDAGGIALKPADEVHATMKNDMSGAGAILGAMLNLGRLGCENKVIGYLMCTDNRPSGTALAMGDVLTVRGGTTVEVKNTDAEGRLVMADALVLATEEDTDAIVDIATLTGASMRALGTQIAGVMGNDAGLVGQVEAAARATDEPVWELPLAHRYRPELDSDIADIKNLGGPNAGAITAALFLEEFVAGKPWAHIDIAGTAQNDSDSSWRPPGCTGFGARLLAELSVDFVPTVRSAP
ncbi:MAG: M17 family peptidase N-terminal domain-containing protein [Acidimicrobiia bacterium]